MSFISDLVGGITGASDAADAARMAAETQGAAALAGVGETRRQFDKLVELMSPFISAGNAALDKTKNLIGLGGADAQGAAISEIENSPEFQALTRQGETAILQNASATGGLRGGNVQGTLAKFRPELLSSLIERNLGRLSGITQIGQASAAGQAAAGVQSGNTVAQLLQQEGAARAGGQIAEGQAAQQGFNSLLKIGSVIGGFF